MLPRRLQFCVLLRLSTCVLLRLSNCQCCCGLLRCSGISLAGLIVDPAAPSALAGAVPSTEPLEALMASFFATLASTAALAASAMSAIVLCLSTRMDASRKATVCAEVISFTRFSYSLRTYT